MLPAEGNILLLAGDIVPFIVMEKHTDFFNYIADNFECTYWVPGNHEYYYSDVADKCGAVHEKIRPNVFLVNNQTIKLDGVRLIFSTLWSKISPIKEWTIQQSIADFEVIQFSGERFSPHHFNLLHQEALGFLSAALTEKKQDKTIVITHHVPTLMNYPPLYKNNPLNEAFAVELHDFIGDAGADYWIYGHHHSRVQPFEIGKTKLITNQLGYVKYKEHIGFEGRSYIEV